MDPWDLRIGEPFDAGAGGRTRRVTPADGTPAVLEHAHPHREPEHEADALERWDGQGAVRLLARDGWTLLLERCEPLSRVGCEAALDVLVNQGPHGDNVRSARREPWLPIDPRPLLAEREFALAPIVRSAELGHSRRAVLYRLDRDRARLWALGATIAWAIGGPPSHLDVARWPC